MWISLSCFSYYLLESNRSTRLTTSDGAEANAYKGTLTVDRRIAVIFEWSGSTFDKQRLIPSSHYPFISVLAKREKGEHDEEEKEGDDDDSLEHDNFDY